MRRGSIHGGEEPERQNILVKFMMCLGELQLLFSAFMENTGRGWREVRSHKQSYITKCFAKKCSFYAKGN